MSNEDKSMFSLLNQSRIIALFLLIVAPLNYLSVAYYNLVGSKTSEFIDIIMPILLIYGIFAPFVLLIIKKTMLIAYNKGKMKFKSPEHAWRKLSIMQTAVVSGIFAFGFIIFLMSGDIQRMLYFYPIGVVWVFFGWPTRKRYENFIEQIKQQ